MGLFDWFRKKNTADRNQAKTDATSLLHFKAYYLYGFTTNPNNTAKDNDLLIEVYQRVIGDVGGIAINNSFHPYYIINRKGLTVWNAAYLKVACSEDKDELLQRVTQSTAVCVADTASIFNELNVWPDTRLTDSENPVFSRYVPFIIPFLVYDTGKPMRWDYEIRQGIAEKGHASDYVEAVTKSVQFFMPAPTFVIGFDEFDEKAPSALIDNFISSKRIITGS